MDYRLATAMRGPDCHTNAAREWKGMVTAPLRWLAAKQIGKSPYNWAYGRTYELYLAPTSFELKQAQRFAAQRQSGHVKEHANWAFCYLIKQGKTKVVKEKAKTWYNKLIEWKLL